MSDTIIAGIIIAIVNGLTNGMGFRAVARDIGEKLKTKVDLSAHRAGMTQLHNEKNELAKQVAVQNEQIKRLDAEVAHLKGGW